MGSPPNAGTRAMGMRKCWGVPFLAVGLCAAPALAADLPTEKPPPIPVPALPSTWHYEATLVGWGANVLANVGVRNLPILPVSIDFFQILEHLRGIVPVAFVAYNDNFLVGADLLWLRLGTNETFGPGALGGVSAGLVLNETIAAAYGGVRVPTPSPEWSVYGILGARVFNVNTTINLDVPVVGFARSNSQGKTWADEIIGVKARHRIDDKWFLDFETDAGGYSRSATAQIQGAVGYNWTQHLTSTVGFRVTYVYYQTAANSGNGTFRFQETLYGPQFNTTYAF